MFVPPGEPNIIISSGAWLMNFVSRSIDIFLVPKFWFNHFTGFNMNETFYYVSILKLGIKLVEIYQDFWIAKGRFSYAGNWKLVKSIAGTKFRRSYIWLHSQARNRLWQVMALLFFCAMIISVQKLIQVIKSNSAEFLRMQRHNRKILKRIIKKTTETNWDWSKKVSWLILVRTCKMSLLLISRF